MNRGHRWKCLAALLALALFVPVAAQEENAKPEGEQDRTTLRDRIQERLRAAPLDEIVLTETAEFTPAPPPPPVNMQYAESIVRPRPVYESSALPCCRQQAR